MYNFPWTGAHVAHHPSALFSRFPPVVEILHDSGNRTHRYMSEFILLASIRTIASCDLDHMHCDVRRGVGAHVMRVVDYAHFSLNKFESLNITHGYNALPLKIFDHAFHKSSTKPNPCTNFSHNHNVHSWLKHSLVNFFNIKSRYSLSHVSHEMWFFGSHRSYLTSEDNNNLY